MQSMVQLLHLNNFRFGSARLKLDSAGESDRYESQSEASEEESDAALDWDEDAKSAFSESSESSSHQDSDSDGQEEEFSPNSVTLESLAWVATLGVGGYGRVELVTSGINKIPFALKKMKKNEVSLHHI